MIAYPLDDLIGLHDEPVVLLALEQPLRPLLLQVLQILELVLDLRLLVGDVFTVEVMPLDQASRQFLQILHRAREAKQIALHALEFLEQRLHRVLVFAVVRRIEQRLFLFDPLLGFRGFGVKLPNEESPN